MSDRPTLDEVVRELGELNAALADAADPDQRRRLERRREELRAVAAQYQRESEPALDRSRLEHELSLLEAQKAEIEAAQVDFGRGAGFVSFRRKAARTEKDLDSTIGQAQNLDVINARIVEVRRLLGLPEERD